MVNKVILIGNVGKDPEYNEIKEGLTKATFSLATSETWKDKEGNKKTDTQWHNCIAWRGLSKVIRKYVGKGDKLYIEGKLQYGKYTDKNNIERYTTTIVVTDLKMLGNKPKEPKKEEPEDFNNGDLPPWMK